MSVTFKSNLDLVLKMMRANNEDAAKAAAAIAVESVQERMLYGYKDLHGKPPHTEIVDTETLFDSIKGESKKASQNVQSVSVGTSVPYAKYVHEGYTQPAGLRFKGKDGNYLAHTLNNTVVAPPRMLIAFLENNLQKDGSIKIPEPLRMYMGGKDVIKR